jgi:hypothetical protein
MLFLAWIGAFLCVSTLLGTVNDSSTVISVRFGPVLDFFEVVSTVLRDTIPGIETSTEIVE